MSWGYHFAHETHSPSELLEHVRLVEEAGLDHATCSDHFHPWLGSQGHSGSSFAWLGAALARSERLEVGVIAAPGQRQHPAMVAQAIATLAEMFPRRAWIALGTGEALNEHVTGDRWPNRKMRRERLLECVTIIRRLLAGSEVTLQGKHAKVSEARLYTRPSLPPPIFGAALTADGAEWCARWADGLLVGGTTPEDTAALVKAYRDARGRGPVQAQVLVAWADTTERARAIAHERWPMIALEPSSLTDLPTPADFESAVAAVTERDVASRIACSGDAKELGSRLRDIAASGVDRVYIHPLVDDTRAFLRTALPEMLGDNS